MQDVNSKDVIIMAAVVFLVMIFGAYNFGYKNGSKSGVSGRMMNGALPPAGMMRSIFGTIEKVDGSTLIIKTFQAPIAGNAGQSEYTVSIDEKTTLEKLIQRDSTEFQKEQAKFMEDMKNGKGATNGTRPPEPFIREKITISDIKVGDSVSAFSTTDIPKGKKFTAEKVSIQPKVAMPANFVAPSVTGTTVTPPVAVPAGKK